MARTGRTARVLAHRLARRCAGIIRQNLTFALGAMAVLVVGGLFFELPLPLAVIGHGDVVKILPKYPEALSLQVRMRAAHGAIDEITLTRLPAIPEGIQP